ncbi:hypothetical protein DT351_10970 (plasmid) [Latilactobacillus curvatus]|uniref:Uncharacterized protein n=1 Tax=Latilactobacillus curvatus TaxID=28038 RepID=A0A385AGQ5_LATCU|nr:hypothetical protein DT351_10970 [Latilactobacillus curvatus]
MWKVLPYSKQLNLKQAYNDKLSITDFFIVGGAFGASILVGLLLFSQYIWPFFMIAVTIIAYVMVSPSGEPNTKNYQKLKIVILKKRAVYHSINRPKERWWR